MDRLSGGSSEDPTDGSDGTGETNETGETEETDETEEAGETEETGETEESGENDAEGRDELTIETASGSPNGDGWPPEQADPPDEREIDTDAFERYERDGVEVPLVPVDVAHYWFQRREARFVDARGLWSYDALHVTGAAFSPAPDGREDDPVDDWPAGDRIVCYCKCPHHLSTQRAATLLENGYEEVYAIDEGFGAWIDRGYPTVGTRKAEDYERIWTIEGEAPGADEGAFAWAWHDPSGQREAAPIDAAGRYEIELPFLDVDEESTIRIETPTYELAAPLGELTEGVVTPPEE